MATPDATALQRSDLNNFLFADVGTEASGMTLSVVSLFARQGNDPWREADRLAGLPKSEATASLAANDCGHAAEFVVPSGCCCDRCSSDRLVAGAAGRRGWGASVGRPTARTTVVLVCIALAVAIAIAAMSVSGSARKVRWQ